MVYGFAEQSGGRVAIKSKEGEGTSVTIVLPAHQTTGVVTNHEPPARSLSRGSGRILLVEDDPNVLQLIDSQLRSLGYEVTAVSDAHKAGQELQAGRRFDLMLTDIVLPKGVSGVELHRTAKELCPNLRVIFTSGYSEDVFAHEGRPPDIPLLRKPFKRRDLVEAVQRALA
jgi:CheY-like chemotaxis protein